MISDQITIGSYNCSGLAENKKRHDVFSWLKNKNYQIFRLQETHSLAADEVLWQEEWEGPIYFSHGSRKSKGVMILFKKHFDFTVSSIQTDTYGRWVVLNVIVEDKKICLVNLYGPNIDDPLFFETICEITQNLQSTCDHTIMVGDYNTVLNSTIDRKGNKITNYHQCALKEIINTMDTLDLVDIWRLKNPDTIKYTWRRLKQASHID